MEILPRVKLRRQTLQSELHEVAVDLEQDAERLLEEEGVVDLRDQTLQKLHDQRILVLQALHEEEFHQDLSHHDQQDALQTLHEEEGLDLGLSLAAHEEIADTAVAELEEGDRPPYQEKWWVPVRYIYRLDLYVQVHSESSQ
jgi:hypothetical protein